MNTWIYFVLLSELMWALTSLIDKIMISKNHIKSPFVFIIFNGLMNVLLLFLLPFFSFGKLGAADIVISLAAGIFLTFGVIFYYKAVQNEEISRVLIMWQFTPIFVLLFSFLFLKEILTANYLIGFFLLLAGGLAVSYKKMNSSFKLSKSFYYMVASTLLISIYYISSARIYEATDFWSAFMWLRLSAFSSVFLLILPSVRNNFAGTWKNMKPGIKSLIALKMFIDFSAFIVLGLAVLNGPIALISALGSAAAPIFIFLITIFTTIYLPHIIKENISGKIILIKILAIALTIAGIVFVNL